MDFEVSYTLESEQQFWDELDDIVSAHCESHELIDNALRSYLHFTTNYKGEYLQDEHGIARCSYKLLESALFLAHKDYIRRQIVYSLLQEDSADTLHFIVAFLLFDGRENEITFEMMNEEGAFPILVELIQGRKDDDAGLHRTLLELLYEMSRIQRLRMEDLMLIEDTFILYLLSIIEGLSSDASDPYHYPVIRVLLILNEQYMVTAHTPPTVPPPPPPRRKSRVASHPKTPTVTKPPSATPLTNRVLKTLSTHGPAYQTFGENLILVLNRESETSLQLLILKLLYLLFTTPATYEYFYTNDLRVLLDVIIRNLLDLPLTATALRHTYLRVLYPLLAHTQLRDPPHYKRDELLRLLHMMTSEGGVGVSHFGAVDETTRRLVGRCVKVAWLIEEEMQSSPTSGKEQTSPTSPTNQENANGAGKKQLLGVEQVEAMASSLSVVEVAAQRERPGVKTESRREVEGGSSEVVAKEGIGVELGRSPFEAEGQ